MFYSWKIEWSIATSSVADSIFADLLLWLDELTVCAISRHEILFCTYVLCTYSCDAYEYIFHHLLTSITERRNEVINYEVEYCRLILYNNIVKLKVVQYHRLKYMLILTSSMPNYWRDFMYSYSSSGEGNWLKTCGRLRSLVGDGETTCAKIARF